VPKLFITVPLSFIYTLVLKSPEPLILLFVLIPVNSGMHNELSDDSVSELVLSVETDSDDAELELTDEIDT